MFGSEGGEGYKNVIFQHWGEAKVGRKEILIFTSFEPNKG